ncbi:MAG TPA: hypothetical protein PK472_01300 [Pseudomonadota bacterium]|nr:hypothetical protein [Pseudomonadota bacterium]
MQVQTSFVDPTMTTHSDGTVSIEPCFAETNAALSLFMCARPE